MKKSPFPAALLLIGAGLSGCPVYDDDSAGCYDDFDCGHGYLCDDLTGSCYAEEVSDACRKPSDCGTNETCGRLGTCSTGDCHYASVGCVRGYVCSSESGRWECLANAGGGQAGQGGAEAGGATTSGGEATSGAGSASDAGGAASHAGGVGGETASAG